MGLILLVVLSVGAALGVHDEPYALPSANPSRSDRAPGQAHASGTPASGSTLPSTAANGTLGRIQIGRLGISAIIAEGTDDGTLKRAVGHVSSTSQPGDLGNVALAAHRDGLFRGLGGVRPNDLIVIVTPRASYSYRVEYSVVVGPERVDLLDSTPVPSLTLITCYPFHWIGHAPKRFVVRAVQFDPLARDSRQPTDGHARRT